MVIDRIRSFNRFYTQKIGLITNRFLNSEYSLVQARVLFELSRRPLCHASDLSREFGLSPDYLSKLISKFESQGLISRTPSPEDSRKQMLALTPEGKKAYAALKERSNQWIEKMIQGMEPEQTDALVSAMNTIEQVLDPAQRRQVLVTLRAHRPGDIGYVIHRHGVLYAREYGFNHEFDAYVAKGMAAFIENVSDRDHLWIAETQGTFSGSVAVVRRDENTAQLRWLIVEPKDRGKGIGKQLINETVRFAKDKGFDAIMLWTIDFLHAARRLYASAGFSLTETKTNRIWGKTLTEECWTLPLKEGRGL
jgi:DNA-binding MarR family transcriptional regulator/GNAT superfamily N-acetyltransferase